VPAFATGIFFVGLVHQAAWLATSPEPLVEHRLTDGLANTLLAGEASSTLRPWGDPDNLRDPALGVNQAADGFGGPDGRGGLMLLADGSVRFLSRDTDPEVLRALATYAGGDD
jgi:hypothetical protein